MKRDKKTNKKFNINQIYLLITNLNFKLVLASIFMFLSLWGLLFADTGDGSLECILLALCNNIMGIIPSLAFLLVTAAAVVYAAGQLFDAQTRAKAQQWAISCLVGAVIGAVILFVVPAFLGALIKMSASGVTAPSCNATGSSTLCTDAVADAIGP